MNGIDLDLKTLLIIWGMMFFISFMLMRYQFLKDDDWTYGNIILTIACSLFLWALVLIIMLIGYVNMLNDDTGSWWNKKLKSGNGKKEN